MQSRKNTTLLKTVWSTNTKNHHIKTSSKKCKKVPVQMKCLLGAKTISDLTSGEPSQRMDFHVHGIGRYRQVSLLKYLWPICGLIWNGAVSNSLASSNQFHYC